MLCQLKNPLFRSIHDHIQRLILQITVVCNLFIDLDHLPKSCFFADDLCVVLNICRGLGVDQKFSCKLQSADLRRSIFLFQMLLQCDQIHRLPCLKQFYHRVKQHSVCTLIEILPCKHLSCDHNCIFIHQHGAHNRLLRFCAVGQYSFNRCFHKLYFPLCFFHGNIQLCCHFRMQFYRYDMCSQCFDLLFQLNLLFINI